MRRGSIPGPAIRGPAEKRPFLPGAADAGGVLTGRSFASVRQGAKTIAGRWARSARALRKEEQSCGEELAKLATAHSSEAFVACDSPLEAALFSALVGLLRQQEEEDVDL